MAPTMQCSRCGAPLPPDPLPGGVCPRCLLKLGLESEPASAGDEAADEVSTQISASGPPTTPVQIGPYRILEVLGEGGMGIVYLAEQEAPIRRRVALKLIKLGLDTRDVLARFESERQALALMNHPSIAKVLDAGMTEQGRPYFVMEPVAGVPITEFCDRQRLDTRSRLELFIQVCEAIQHAHQKGIIHRDIKPSNVLVELQDGKPVPKVIDFGVAKATSQRLTEKTLFTRHGVLIGTPEYMSPEQAEVPAVDVDTRTDIYSLGVLLYELLVGHPPFDAGTLRRAGFEEMRRIIRENEPPTPSSRLNTVGSEASELARRRHTDARSLVRQLRDDLDWITIKALEKDRARRYASASEFAADVRRHLNSEPVAAGPPSAAYRLRKLVRKNRRPILAGLGVAASLLVGAVVSFGLYLRSEAARELAEQEALRNRLEVEALQAALLEDVETYRRLARQALDMHRKVLGPDNPRLAAYLVSGLLVLDLLGGSEDRGRLRELEREAVSLINRALEEGRADALTTLVLLADYLKGKDDPEVERLYRRGLALAREELARIDRGESEEASREPLIRFLGTWDARRLKEADDEMAEGIFREAVAMRRRTFPPHAPGLLKSLADLAGVLERRAAGLAHEEKFEQAVALFREILDLRREAAAGSAPVDLSETESELGGCLLALRRFEEAEPLLRSSHEALRKRLGDRNALTQEARNRILELYEAWGQPAKAAPYRAARQHVSVESVREVGPFRFSSVIRSRSGGHSARLGNRSVWVFGETSFSTSGEDRSGPRGGTWCWTEDLDAGNGLAVFHEQVDPGGSPVELIPLTEEEEAFNEAHRAEACTANCGARWLLRPGAFISDPVRGRSLVFYTKVFRERTPPRDLPGGGSLAVWRSLDERPVRAEVRPGAEDPTLLFGPDEPAWGSAALVVGSDLYAYASECKELDCPCLLARAPLAHALERSAWRFYAGKGAWSPDWRDARSVLQSTPAFSVHWNGHLGKYLAVRNRIISNKIVIATADRPEGPWSEAFELDAVVPDTGFPWTNSAVGHPELARENGRIEYLTYVRNTGFFRSETRLVELTFQ